jgi:hypothetical protein
MSKDKISDYSATPGNNTDIGGINIAEGMLPSDVNNAIREQMAQLKKFQSGASGESVTFVTANVTTANAGQVNVDNLRLDGNVLSSTNTNGNIELTPNGNGRVTTSALSATSPRVITAINDTNGNELFGVTATGSAVNEFTVANAATGNAPTLSATGSDTNIGMALTPKGTGGVIFPAGAVGTPAITTTGDLNTGIFFPAADQVAVATNGVERVNLGNSETVFNDGGGDVDFRVEGDTVTNLLFVDASRDAIGVGVNPYPWAQRALQVGVDGSLSSRANIVDVGMNIYFDGSNYKYGRTFAASNYKQQDGSHQWFCAASGTAGNNITFTKVLEIDRTKTLALEGANSQTGIGITFPATQSASSDVNTLDDYEEGVWTPTITFGGGSTGITYSVRVGTYTKVGRMVTAACSIGLSSKGVSTGNVSITGLPFTTEASHNYATSVFVDSITYTGMVISQTVSTSLIMYQSTEAGVTTALTNSNFVDSSFLRLNVTYFV